MISGAGDLQAKHVIHAVGPVWNGGYRKEADLLASAYQHCLKLAVDHDCHSIAFPSLSTGAYRYPLDQAAGIALRTVWDYLQTAGQPEMVRFVLFGNDPYAAFHKALTGLRQKNDR